MQLCVRWCDTFLLCRSLLSSFFFFFFNDTATTEIYTLSLHDALPISDERDIDQILRQTLERLALDNGAKAAVIDRKSTRLNSSHLVISYAVFCLKKKKKKMNQADVRTTLRCIYSLRPIPVRMSARFNR